MQYTFYVAWLLGLIVAVIDPLDSIKSKSDRKKGIVLLAFVILAAALTMLSYIDSERRASDTVSFLESTNDELQNTQKYTHVAILGLDGAELSPGPGMFLSTPLFDALKGSYYRDDAGVFRYYCGAHEEQYLKAIEIDPYFPFSYYALADCKKQPPERDWRPDVEKAISILKETTKIGGHKPEHDQILERLLSWQEE